MAERPDLDYALPILAEALSGRVIEEVVVKDPVVLRLMEEGTPEELLVGQRVTSLARRAHFAHFGLSGRDLLIAPMLAGRFDLGKRGGRRRKDTVFVLGLGDVELRYRDDVRMGKVYVCPHERWTDIPGLGTLGLDALDPDVFTLDAFSARIRKRRDQVRLFLMDKSEVDALGNAYADEVLFEAKVHPKTRCNKLSDAQVEALHRAVPAVLAGAAAELEARQPPLDEKLRDFLKVRNRKGEPCPRCGARIRVAGVRGYDSFFCGSCQRDGGSSGLIDWSRVGR
ncbi:MAG: endonuclease VIII [Deltaproteobacteria bacterium]|nr:MAG: endonuclease VIII [Deltaproteobacteria bacterium]